MERRLTPEVLVEALDNSEWLIALAARRLGVTRQAVYEALRRHGIRRRIPTRAAIIEAKRRGGRQPKRRVIA